MLVARVAVGIATLVAAGSVASSAGATRVWIVVSDARLEERDGGVRELAFAVRAIGGLAGEARVAFATGDGTAREGRDYVPSSGSLSFDTATRVRTVQVRVRGDDVDEVDETLALVLSSATGATVWDAHGIGTIEDDDGPPLDGVRVAAAGDIACDPESAHFEEGRGDGLRCRQLATSELLVRGSYAAVLALGDIQYESGSEDEFRESYDLSWGRVRPSTRPVPGNHDYATDGAPGYFEYFGPAAGDPEEGYYGFDLAGWHVVALNSNCREAGGCGVGSRQERWLRADLAAHPARCTLAFMHHPRFSSGEHGSDETYAALVQALHDAGADLLLVGHDHHYERFAPQDAVGRLDLRDGIRQFVVGTGGKETRGLGRLRPNSEARDTSTLGVLELTLGEAAYAWRFRPAVGSFTDRGSASCH